MSTAFFTHAAFRRHDNGPHHPERPARLEAIDDALRAAGLWDALQHPPFEPASAEQLYACHSVTLVESVRRLAEDGGGQIDHDTRISPASFEVAALAAGAATAAVDGVLRGEYSNAFVAARPPGHHAERARAMGFCLFNHVAVAARHAQHKWGLERVAIVDWDVHHGNGTQEIFYRDGHVFYASVHQSPLFPGTGRAGERGEDAGHGTTANFPLPPGQDDIGYLAVWREIGDLVAAFEPEMILLSAGFDAHARDPLGGMELSAAGFAALMRETLDWAAQRCEGRLVAVLEGGYDLGGLGESAAAVLQEMRQA